MPVVDLPFSWHITGPTIFFFFFHIYINIFCYSFTTTLCIYIYIYVQIYRLRTECMCMWCDVICSGQTTQSWPKWLITPSISRWLHTARIMPDRCCYDTRALDLFRWQGSWTYLFFFLFFLFIYFARYFVHLNNHISFFFFSSSSFISKSLPRQHQPEFFFFFPISTISCWSSLGLVQGDLYHFQFTENFFSLK